MPRTISPAAGYTSLPNGDYIPEIWSKKMNVLFWPATCLNKITNNDHEAEISGFGSKVHIRTEPTPTVSAYAPGKTITYENINDGEVELDIDKSYYWAYAIDSLDKAQADVAFAEKLQKNGVNATVKQVEREFFQSVYSSVAAANQMASKQITKANILDQIIDAEVLMGESDIPEETRWWGVIPYWAAGMIAKSELKDVSLSGDSETTFRKGTRRIGMIGNFELFRSNNLYDDATTWHALFGSTLFCTFANQFKESRLGFPLESTIGYGFRGVNLYGYQVVQPTAGVYMPMTK